MLRVLALIAALLVATLNASQALAALAKPTINRVLYDLEASPKTMSVTGTGFVSPLTVKIGSNSLMVASFTATSLVANIPATLVPGDYKLSVTNSSGSATWTLTYGAVGPQGPQGVQGLTGAQGLRGIRGATGAPGATGATGAQGDRGMLDPGSYLGAVAFWNGTEWTSVAQPLGSGDAVLRFCDGSPRWTTSACCSGPCPTDAAGWWPAENSVEDRAGRNSGRLLNGAGYSAGQVGQAFSFDGNDDYVDIPHSSDIFFSNSSAFTLEVWFKAESESTSFFVLKNAGYGLRWEGSNSPLAFYNGTYHYSTTTQWGIGTWHHVVMVDDGSNSVALYVDGELDAVDEGNLRAPNRFPCLPAYCFALQIGGAFENNMTAEFFRGQVDEVVVYGRALSGAEINERFLKGSK